MPVVIPQDSPKSVADHPSESNHSMIVDHQELNDEPSAMQAGKRLKLKLCDNVGDWRVGFEGLETLVPNNQGDSNGERRSVDMVGGTGMEMEEVKGNNRESIAKVEGSEYDYYNWYNDRNVESIEKDDLNVEIGYVVRKHPTEFETCKFLKDPRWFESNADSSDEEVVYNNENGNGDDDDDEMEEVEEESDNEMEMELQEYNYEKKQNYEKLGKIAVQAEKQFFGLQENESIQINQRGTFIVRNENGRTSLRPYDRRRRRRRRCRDGDKDEEALDVTWADAANGVDLQGIPWQNLPFTREDYRATRLRDGRQVEANGLGPIPDKPFIPDIKDDVNKDNEYYTFYKNTRRVKSSIIHFQLRNLVWATSRHDVYIADENVIYHWDAASCRKRIELRLSPSAEGGGGGFDGSSVDQGLIPDVQVSTLMATEDWLVAGGFYGHVIAKNLKTNKVAFCKKITHDDNAITNAIDIFDDNQIMVSNNDKIVRIFDGETFQVTKEMNFGVAINHATKQPNGKLITLVGDENTALVIDGSSQDKVAELYGHKHFSFATGWHPDGRIFATGSQDDTCRVWDVRNMSRSLVTLGAHMGAIRSLRFSSCGRFLALAEPRDFAHIYDVSRGSFDMAQEIDIFGEIAGITFSPDADSLFLGIWDNAYGSLLEFEKKVSHKPYGPNAYM